MNNITIKCPRCGSENFNIPRRDLQLTDRISCTSCGHSDTYEGIAGPVAKKHMENALKDAFKNIKLDFKI